MPEDKAGDTMIEILASGKLFVGVGAGSIEKPELG